MSSDGCGSLRLIPQVVKINLGKSVSWFVIVRIILFIGIPNLDYSRDSLLTEGTFVPSSTARNDLRNQVDLVSLDGIFQYLS